MIIYRGIAKAKLSKDRFYTTSLTEAVAIAAIECHQHGLPIEHAIVNKAVVQKYQVWLDRTTTRSTHYSLRYDMGVKALSYTDLRDILSAGDWAVLNAPITYLKNFIHQFN